MKVAIRVDDVGMYPRGGRDEGLRLAQRFHEAMQGAPYLAAVVPFLLDDRGRAWLKSQRSGMTVGMHGVTHRMVRPGLESEFSGRELNECSVMIELGKLALGVPTRHFVAPWNHYGEHLDDALDRHGIMVHWTGPTVGPDPEEVAQAGERWIVPAWKRLYGCLLWPSGGDERPLSYRMASVMEREGRAVMTLHITWEGARGEEFSGVRWFMERYGDQVISPDELVR